MSVLLALVVITFILLLLSFALPTFAYQFISQSCQATNPSNGNPLTELYYNLMNGIGSDPECSANADNFCLQWTNMGLWARIDQIAFGADMELEAATRWQTAQVITTVITNR